jgi:hypothetical protein
LWQCGFGSQCEGEIGERASAQSSQLTGVRVGEVYPEFCGRARGQRPRGDGQHGVADALRAVRIFGGAQWNSKRGS